MHPSKDIIGTESKRLEGEKVALCLTGSVAVIKTPELARALMRHGAEVRVVMSEDAENLISSDMMNWASGNPVITELTGEVEHVDVAQWADVILIAPATANTIGKIASGIDDTPPTSVVSVSMGLDKPISIVPAMHESMYSHDIVQENISKLKEAGVNFLEPDLEEGKAKISNIEEIRDHIMSLLHPGDLEGEKVLVTAGPTMERLDEVRVLTNKSSGKMGISIAKASKVRGADVTLIYGPGSEPAPVEIDTVEVETTEEMLEAVEEEMKEDDYDMFASVAAPQDFKPKETIDGKVRRNGDFSPKLEPTPDILERVSELTSETYLIGFKAEVDVDDDVLKSAAEEKMEKHNLDLVVANDLKRSGSGFGTDTNEVLICSGSDFEKVKDTKHEIAHELMDIFSKNS